jgi:hypothetical protein
MKIYDLPSEFLLKELQIERLTALPQYIVQNHIQVVNHNGTFYHLNPDLEFDVNQNSALSCMCRKSNDQRSREYCSRQRLWLTWQFEITEWYNPECLCTSLIIQH